MRERVGPHDESAAKFAAISVFFTCVAQVTDGTRRTLGSEVVPDAGLEG